MLDALPIFGPEQYRAFAHLLAMAGHLSPAALLYGMILLAHRLEWPWLAELAYCGLILSAVRFD